MIVLVLNITQDARIKELLQLVKDSLQDILGNKLMDVVLYGSYARNQSTPDSDLDILALVDESDSELRKYEDSITDVMVDLSLEYEIVVSIHLQSYDIYKKYTDVLPFFINVNREGVSLYG